MQFAGGEHKAEDMTLTAEEWAELSQRLPTAKNAEAKGVCSHLFHTFGKGAPNLRSLFL